MTKAEFIDAIAAEAKITKTDAEKAVKAYASVVTDALKKGDKITLVGFGTYEVGARAARTGRNPQTGETIKIKAAKTPKFKAGKALKDAVNAPKKSCKKK